MKSFCSTINPIQATSALTELHRSTAPAVVHEFKQIDKHFTSLLFLVHVAGCNFWGHVQSLSKLGSQIHLLGIVGKVPL
ncbi:MAG: hypothetical protein RH917_14375 [Lacipirellulaceae bacterium]